MCLFFTLGNTMTLVECWFLYLLTLLSFHPSLCSDSNFDCKTSCSTDLTDPNYRPQECRDKCGQGEGDEEDQEDLLKGVVEDVRILKVLVIALLVLVVLLLVLFMVNLATNRKLKKVLQKFYSKMRNKDPDPSIERDPRNSIRDGSSTIAKLNYPSSYSPTASQGGPQLTSSIRRDCSSRGSPSKERRGRMPSESTCPDDSQGDTTGYDNLAMSTSTISFHSRPSSPNSPVNLTTSSDTTRISIATLSTTVV